MSAEARRAIRRDQLKQDIITAARELFVRDGYESFSMRKLAGAIEYSPASIYKHFTSKDELFEEIVRESFARLDLTHERARRGQQPDPVTALKKGLLRYIDFGLQNPGDYRFAFLMQSATVRMYKPSGAFESLKQRVAACIEAGSFQPIDIDLAAQALWAAAHGITSLLIMKPQFPWVTRRKLIQQVIDSAVDGLLKR